jgi:hypothetical protein
MRRRGPIAAIVLGVFAALGCGGGGGGDDLRAGRLPTPDRTDTDASGEVGGEGEIEEGASESGVPGEGESTAPVAGELECDPTKPFGTPVLLLDPGQRSATPRLSSDELTLYFTADGASTDLFRATRASRSAAFGAPAPMTAQSSPSNDNDPAVSADHLTLFFHSGRSGNNELYMASRASTSIDFGAPALVPDVNDPTVGDAHAYYRSAGGGELFFTSLRGSATYRIHSAKKKGEGFETPAVVPGLFGAWNDWQPMVTEDGLTMLFASTRPEGQGLYDLWMAARASDGAAWGAPVPLTELNSAASEFAGWMSADRCRVYFSSSRDTEQSPMQRVYFAARPL